MKDPLELLRVKEQELLRVKQEIEALRIVAPLLDDEAGPPLSLKIEVRQRVIELP